MWATTYTHSQDVNTCTWIFTDITTHRTEGGVGDSGRQRDNFHYEGILFCLPLVDLGVQKGLEHERLQVKTAFQYTHTGRAGTIPT